MTKFSYLIFLSFCLVLLACCEGKREEYPRYSSFEKEESLTAMPVSLDTILFRYPFRVKVKDAVALVLDLHNADHFLHAFTYPGWKHLVSFGRRGQAPEELLSVESFRFCSSDSVWVVDANKMEVTRWSIDVKGRNVSREEAIPLDKRLIRTLDFIRTDSGFIVPDYTGANRYSLLDCKGNLQNSYEKIPTEQTYTDIALPALAQAWRSFMDYHPEHGLLALATQLGEVLELHNLREGTRTVLYGQEEEPRFQIDAGYGIPTGIMGFSDIQITDHYIYAVFHGRAFRDIIQNQAKGITREDGGRFLYVFDLKGNPVKKYILDRAVYGIDVNEDAGIIIATDVNSDDPVIVFQMASSSSSSSR